MKSNPNINNNESFKSKIGRIIGKYGIYIAFAVISIILVFISPNFATGRNAINILKQISINGIIAIGATFVLILGGIDLSAGSFVALSGMMVAIFSQPGYLPMPLAIVVALMTGVLCGAFNGFIISKGKVPPFIVTLGMMTIARGLSLVSSGGVPIGMSDDFKIIGSAFILGIPVLVYILLAFFTLAFIVLHTTRFGRHIYAIGGNEVAAKVSGLNVDRIKIAVYAIAGLMSAVGGVLLASRILTGSPASGEGYELNAIAAVVIGGTSLSGGVGKIYGTLAGALIIGIMNNGLDLMGLTSYYQQIVKGIIIILAVLLDTRFKENK